MVSQLKSTEQAFETRVEEILSALELSSIREDYGAKGFVRYILSAPDAADYVICVCVYNQSHINIAAMKKPLSINEYLWESSFEVKENRGIPFLIESFRSMITTIVTHETQVRIEKGRFVETYDIDFLEEDTWHSLYPCASVHLQFWRRPPISERKITYRSPAYL